jgi:hypothetical protein
MRILAFTKRSSCDAATETTTRKEIVNVEELPAMKETERHECVDLNR